MDPESQAQAQDWSSALDVDTPVVMNYEEPSPAELASYNGNVTYYRYETIKSLLGQATAARLFRRYREDHGHRKDFRRLYQDWKTDPATAVNSHLLAPVECKTCLQPSDTILLPCGHSHTCKECLDRWGTQSASNRKYDCPWCRQPYFIICDIKWFSEDPEAFFERMIKGNAAMHKRNAKRRRRQRVAGVIAPSQEVVTQS